MDGLLTEVATLTQGSAATADVAAGGTVVPVENLTDFASDGGKVDIAGTVYDYTGVDATGVDPDGVGGSLLLAAPLTVDVSEFDPVLLLVGEEPAVDYYWVVDLVDDESGEPSWLPIQTREQRLAWPVRAYDPPLPVTVVGGQVVGSPGVVPQMDGRLIDPATVPPASVTEPPADSPTLTTTGFKDAISVEAHGTVDQTTILDYYIDGVLAESSHSPIMLFRSDALGNQFQADTEYTFHVVARNAIDSAAPSPAVVGQLNPAVDSETILGIVKAGFALLGSLTVGNITITPPSGTFGADDYDPGGIVIPLASGGKIQFPADGSAAVIEAILRTADLVVSGGLTVNGITNFINGTLFLGSGTADPTAEIGIDYFGVQTKVRLNGTNNSVKDGRGLARTADGTKWGIVLSLPGAGADKKFLIIDATTHNILHEVTSDDALINMKGVTCVGNDFYVLGERWNAGAAENQWRVHKYNGSGVEQATTWLTDENGNRVTSTNPKWFDGAIAADPSGTSFWVAKIQSNNRLRVADYGTAPLNGNPGFFFLGPTSFPLDYLTGGFYVGNADFGAKRFAVAALTPDGHNGVYVFSGAVSPLTHEAGQDFDKERPSGLFWDGTRFVGLGFDSSGGYLYDYDTHLADVDVFAQYTWYDNNPSGGNKESAPSPIASRTIPKRMWPWFNVPAPPNSGTGVDPANAVRVYSDTDATTKLLTTITTGMSAFFAAATLAGTGAAPPGATTFTAASSTGALEAATNGFRVDGGSGGSVGTGTFRDSVRAALGDDYAAGAYTTYTPTLTAATTNPNLGNFTRAGRWTRLKGKTIRGSIVLTCTGTGGTGGVGTGAYEIGLPVPARALREVSVKASQSGPNHMYIGRNDTSVSSFNLHLTSTDAVMSAATSEMVVGTVVSIDFEYEAA